eukprot:6463102-Amphidinium_carterae.2
MGAVREKVADASETRAMALRNERTQIDDGAWVSILSVFGNFGLSSNGVDDCIGTHCCASC